MRGLGVLALVFTVSSWAGERVPGRYIVELTEPPEAWARQSNALGQQQRMRRQMESRRARVRGSVHTVANALIVEVPDNEAAALAALPGVKKVHPVELLELHLDRAVALSRVPEAWGIVGGMANAGAGIRIGILDTGIEARHPGFQDPSLTAPDGFPQISSEENRPFTSGKIIVARSYDPAQPTVEDTYGHGTAVAMAAAGVTMAGPRGNITGVAPKAWIGVYRVNIGSSSSIRSDYVLRALEDAVNDGMMVINMSFGSVGFLRAEDNVFAAALEAARQRGVIIVNSAGNAGSDAMSVDWTASLPNVLAVGASDNDRILMNPSVLLNTGVSLPAQPGSNTYALVPVEGPVASIKTWDPTGLACTALPESSLTGLVVLVQRGECTFEEKLNNVERAGAVAAVIATDAARPEASPWSAGANALPGWMVGYIDGLMIAAEEGNTVMLRGWQAPIDPYRVTSFSGRGPTVEFGIKPDLVAVGHRFLTAGQTVNPGTPLYSPTGTVVTQGTSFAAPIVAGAAAVLRAARPEWTEADYRSLLVNSARPILGGVQLSGSGMLNLEDALRSTIAASPVSLSFGVSSTASRNLTLKNLSSATETFTLGIVTQDSQAPGLSTTSVTIPPGATEQVIAEIRADDLPAGIYQGYVRIQSTGSPVEARVPYWFGIAGTEAARISLPVPPPSDGALNQTLRFRFRVQDSQGLPVASVVPALTVENGDGSIISIDREDSAPASWLVTFRLGPQQADNTYRIDAGNQSRRFTVRGR